MKLAIIISIWQRHDLTKIVFDYYRELTKGYDIEIIIAGSEGEESAALAEGFNYIEVPNYPLSEKNNALLEKAKGLNVDGVILLGSDDFIDRNILDFYYTLENKKNVVGFRDIYFYSTHTGKLAYFSYKEHRTIGAGRFYSKYVLDKMDWKIWKGVIQRGLDKNSQENLLTRGITEEIFSLKDVNGFMVDIKHHDNITNHDILDSCKEVSKKIMGVLGKGTMKSISKLKPLPYKKVISVSQEKQIIDDLYISGIDWDGLPAEVTIIAHQGSKHLKAGEQYTLGKDHAKILIQKGLVKLI